MGIDNKELAQIVENSVKKIFGIKTEVDVESKINKTEYTETKQETVDVKNTWVWVEGYKGTDRNMCCQGYQYEIGKLEQMPRENVDECRTGYHFCLNLHDVFSYYTIGQGNRFFKVRALVRLSDKNEYGKLPEYEPDNLYHVYFGRKARNKLVAAEIEFLEELTVDEILKGSKAASWSDEYKKLAIEIGIDAAETKMQITDLTDLGYSLPFASYILSKKKYAVAKAVGSQPELSMDMRALLIMQD